MDDFLLSGEVNTVAEDVEKVTQSASETGLTLNASTFEIIATNFDLVHNIDTCKDFKRIAPHDIIGSPCFQGTSCGLGPSEKG